MATMLPTTTNTGAANRVAGFFPEASPFAVIDEVRREVDRLFGQALGGWRDPLSASLTPRLDATAPVWVPAMDVRETDREFRLTLEVPGLSPDDLQIEVTDDTLRVAGEKRVERDEQEGAYRLVERRAGRFERRLTLPSDVDAEHVSAEYENGVLTVTAPKRADAKKARRVTIEHPASQPLLGRKEKGAADRANTGAQANGNGATANGAAKGTGADATA